MAESKNKLRYNKIYKKQHRDKQRYYVAKSTAKRFILNADKNDLNQIKRWIKIRENK